MNCRTCNTSACALHLDPGRAGSISLIGLLSFGLGASMSMLTGALHVETARQMALLILGNMLLSAFALFAIARPAR